MFCQGALMPDATDELRNDAAAETVTLQNGDNLYRTLFEMAGVGEAHVDFANGRLLHVNRKLCAMLGYARAELLGKPIEDIVYAEDRARVQTTRAQLASGGLSHYEAERCYLRKDGSTLWVRVNATALPCGTERPTQMVAIIQDITGQKQAQDALLRARQASERSLAQLEAVFESMSEGLIIVDAEGNMLRMNPAARDMAGLDRHQELPDHLRLYEAMPQVWDLRRLDGTPLPLDEWPISFARRRQPFSYHEIQVIDRRTGQPRIGRFHGRPVPAVDDSPPLYVLTFRDVTAQKQAELERIKLLERLEAERQRLRDSEHRLAVLNATLEERVRERTADLEGFAYTVSHDLRAPLRAIEGYADALLEDYPGLDDDARLYLQRISAAAARMNRLIDDLLEYSRLGRQDLILGPVGLDAAVADALEQLAGVLADSGARVDVQTPLPAVRAHLPTLSRVIQNLLANAVKFVPPGRTPRVRIDAAAGHGQVRLTVQDNGIGIAPEHHRRVFQVFERLHSHDKYPGTGIGLAIVRRSLERLGGDCGVESQPGGSSRFWITLPEDQEEP